MFTDDLQEYEIIELPSKGLVYEKTNIFSEGSIKLKYPTAVDENILMSKKLLMNGTAIDTFIKALLINKEIDLNDLIIGDKNALIYAARIMAYGPDYSLNLNCPACNTKNNVIINLNEDVCNKELNDNIDFKNENLFSFILPKSGKSVLFKLITQSISNKIQSTIDKQEKIGLITSSLLTTRLIEQIVEFDNQTDYVKIKKLVETMSSRDSLALRTYINTITPDIDSNFMFVCNSCGHSEKIEIPLTEQFFWPTSSVQ